MENRKKKGIPTKHKSKLTTSINSKLTEADYKTVKEKAEKLEI